MLMHLESAWLSYNGRKAHYRHRTQISQRDTVRERPFRSKWKRRNIVTFPTSTQQKKQTLSKVNAISKQKARNLQTRVKISLSSLSCLRLSAAVLLRSS